MDDPLVNALWLSAKDKSNVNLGFGKRHDTPTYKGLGFFGEVPNKDGVSTEISTWEGMGVAPMEYPLMSPNLTMGEVRGLLDYGPTDDIYRKARMAAILRQGMGASPFAGVGEQPYGYQYPPKFLTIEE